MTFVLKIEEIKPQQNTEDFAALIHQVAYFVEQHDSAGKMVMVNKEETLKASWSFEN